MRTAHGHRNWFFATSLMGLLACAVLVGGCSSSSHEAGDGDAGNPDCPAGTQGPECVACKAGFYCAGGAYKAIACPAGTEDDDSDPATPCILLTPCRPGTYLVAAGPQPQMPMCMPCGSGTFSTVDNAASCTRWTVCDVGTFVAAQGSASSDRECQNCPQGTDSTARNAVLCTTQTDCAAGTAPTTSIPGITTCTACQAGNYCPGGSTPARVCGAVTWDDDLDPATACVPRDTCPAGTYVTDAGSTTTARTCAMCVAGMYNDTVNSSTCKPCADGTYTDMAGSSQCLPYSGCAAGYAPSQPGTATSNQACAACTTSGTFCAGGTAGAIACAAGTWDHDGSPATACVTWTDCSAGQYVISDGSVTSNRSCGSCTSGTASDSANASSCTQCAAGTYSDTSGAQSCMTCLSGTYSDSAGATQCTAYSPCLEGEYPSTAGTTMADQSCSTCTSPGTYCPGGTSQPVNCALGTWDDDSDPATACIAWSTCLPGTYVGNAPDSTTDRTCTTCPGGTVSTTNNATGCSTCPGGSSPNGNQSGCI